MAILFGSICFTGLHWQVPVFINDNYTLVNTLLNVADGRLFFDSFYGAENVTWPGTVQIDGRPYGRSYGIAFAGLPFLWVISVLEPILGLRLVAVGFWSIAVLGLATQVGSMTGRRRAALLAAGSVVALAIGLNSSLVSSSSITPERRYVLALQMAAMTATGAVGALTYRLVAHVEGRTIGLYAGSVTILASNVGFWGWIPKRHVFTCLLAVVAIYGFAVSREPDSLRTELGSRGMPYAAVGLMAWINAAEAAVLFTALVPLDLLTARSNDAKRLAVIASAFALSLIPFLVTNLLTTGEPFTSPLMSSGFGVDRVTDVGPGGGGTGTPGSGSTNGVTGPAESTLRTLLDRAILVVSIYGDGLDAVIGDPTRPFRVFVDRGYDAPNVGNQRNLTVVESMPFLGALVGIIPYSVRRIRRGSGVRPWLRRAAGQTDVLVVAFVLLYTLVYMPRLPLRVQFTVRYLVPITPGLVYLVCRIPSVKRTLRANQSDLLWTYAFGVAGASLGFVLLLRAGSVVGITASDVDLLSLHGSVALVCASLLAVAVIWMIIVADVRIERAIGRLLALGAALGTTLTLLFFLHYSPSELWLFSTFG